MEATAGIADSTRTRAEPCQECVQIMSQTLSQPSLIYSACRRRSKAERNWLGFLFSM